MHSCTASNNALRYTWVHPKTHCTKMHLYVISKKKITVYASDVPLIPSTWLPSRALSRASSVQSAFLRRFPGNNKPNMTLEKLAPQYEVTLYSNCYYLEALCVRDDSLFLQVADEAVDEARNEHVQNAESGHDDHWRHRRKTYTCMYVYVWIVHVNRGYTVIRLRNSGIRRFIYVLHNYMFLLWAMKTPMRKMGDGFISSMANMRCMRSFSASSAAKQGLTVQYEAWMTSINYISSHSSPSSVWIQPWSRLIRRSDDRCRTIAPTIPGMAATVSRKAIRLQ